MPVSAPEIGASSNEPKHQPMTDQIHAPIAKPMVNRVTAMLLAIKDFKGLILKFKLKETAVKR